MLVYKLPLRDLLETDGIMGKNINKISGVSGAVPTDEGADYCPLITQSLVSKLRLSDINYFEYESGKTKIEMCDGTIHYTRQRFEFFMDYIDERFFSVGRFLINMNRIISIDSEAVVHFEAGSRVYLTKKNYVELKQRFAGYMISYFLSKGKMGL